jgi:hypothetical protein
MISHAVGFAFGMVAVILSVVFHRRKDRASRLMAIGLSACAVGLAAWAFMG